MRKRFRRRKRWVIQIQPASEWAFRRRGYATRNRTFFEFKASSGFLHGRAGGGIPGLFTARNPHPPVQRIVETTGPSGSQRAEIFSDGDTGRFAARREMVWQSA